MAAALEHILDACASLLHGAAVRLAWWRARKVLARTPELAALAARYQASPEGRWTIATNDIVALYHFVGAHRPKHILELGTGIGLSTAVMALALKHAGGTGRITGLEQLTKCVAVARELLPAELAPLVEIVEAPPMAFQIPGISGYQYYCGYDWVPPPDARFDMVFLDGPTGWLEGDALVSVDSGDLYRILPALTKGCLIYVDGRRGAVKMAERYLGAYYEVIERGSEYTVLRVKETPASLRAITVRDTKLEALRGVVYFPKAP